jgi:hypothetical protein
MKTMKINGKSTGKDLHNPKGPKRKIKIPKLSTEQLIALNEMKGRTL